MAARPVGALLFGHIGDTKGRTRALMLGIILMAGSTMAIGCLPTYDIGPYTAGIAAPILLIIFRVLQAGCLWQALQLPGGAVQAACMPVLRH